MGLPSTVIAYTLSRDMKPLSDGFHSVRAIIIACVIGNLIIVSGYAALIIQYSDALPVMVTVDGNAAGIWYTMTAIILLLCSLAFGLLLFRRRSVLDLWLMIACLAWLLDSILLNLISSRFDVGWYANRFYALVSASAVLLVLLAESTMLYARLALSVLAHQREREGRTATMSAIAASFAHEIEQPLTVIGANSYAASLNLANSPPDVEEAQAALADIQEETQRAGQIIDAIRSVFHKAPSALLKFDIEDLLRETLTLMQDELQRETIQMRLTFRAGQTTITAHRGQLQQVLVNVFRNAVDAMRGIKKYERTLYVVTENAPDDHIAIHIHDTGVGLDEKNAERIFELFFSTKTTGTGVGLAMCRTIVEAHGGRIWAEPAEKMGSIFHVVLPLTAQSQANTN